MTAAQQFVRSEQERVEKLRMELIQGQVDKFFVRMRSRLPSELYEELLEIAHHEEISVWMQVGSTTLEIKCESFTYSIGENGSLLEIAKSMVKIQSKLVKFGRS